MAGYTEELLKAIKCAVTKAVKLGLGQFYFRNWFPVMIERL